MFSEIVNISFRIQKYLSICILAIMIVIVGLQVFFRYFLNTPLSWTEELARILQIWLIFSVIGYISSQREHIEIGYFVEKLPVKLQIIIRSLIDLLILVFSIVLIYLALKLAILQWPAKSTALELPLTYFSIPFGLSSFFMIVHYIDLLMKDMKDFRDGTIGEN